MDQKLQDKPEIEKEVIKPYLDYLKCISEEYTEFRKVEDDMVLFGGELELSDIKRCVEGGSTAQQMQVPFVIVPIVREDFEKLSDIHFLQLQACFGVNWRGTVYPRVDSSV